MIKIFLAIGHPQIHDVIRKFTDVEVCGEVFSRKDLTSALGKVKPDILIVSEFLKETKDLDLVPFLVQIREKMPMVRVIYLAGNMDTSNPIHRQRLQTVIQVGIYDIYTMNSISPRLLETYIYSPGSIENVLEWLDDPVEQLSQMSNHEPTLQQTSLGSFIEENQAKVLAAEVMKTIQEQDEDDYVLRNVFVVSSIKPGSGKSFVSSNLATAIAKFGAVGPHGRPPTVALIEGDLQNVSIGTLLSFQEDKQNLKTAIEKIDAILDRKTSRFKSNVTQQEIDEVDKFIKGCLKPYNKVKNLYALVGSQFKPDELKLITAQHYVYLIETISELFDVVIVDSNSSLNHVTTYPLLQLANRCFYVLNLDFNNVHNNHRYRQKLTSLGIKNKLVYLLNEDITQNKDNKEELQFGPDALIKSGYEISGRIPAIDKSVFLNRLHAGIPIILDNSNATLKARLELSKIADSIWPMDNLEELEAAYEKYELTNQQEAKQQKQGFFSFLKRK